MKKILIALLIGLSSVSGAQAAKSASKPAELTVDQLRAFAPRVRLLRAEPSTLTLHVGQTMDLSALEVIVLDGSGRRLGVTRDFDFGMKPGEPASVFPKRITAQRVGKTVLTLHYPRSAWSGTLESRPSVDVPVTIVK